MSTQEGVRATLDRIASDDLNAFLDMRADEAMRAADCVNERVAAGEDRPLAGVPVAIKDNICWGRTTCASRFLEHYVSPFDATVVERLVAAGAIPVGKTNLDEFAMGSSCEHSAFGPTRNPWDPSRVPGGSSGGSAAAVAAGLVPLALGSDTGGSIRQPAALCGVVGLKPTYGRVSRWGLVAFASSLDQIGPIAKTVTECARALTVIAGFDPRDSTSVQREQEDFAAEIETPIENLTIGVPEFARSEANHPGVTAGLERAIEVYRSLGAEVIDVAMPHAEHGIAAYYIVAPAEASSNLARYDGVRFGRRAELAPGEGLEDLYAKSRSEGFGPEVKRRIMLGAHVLSSGYHDAYYLTALRARRLIKRDHDEAFGTCDALLMPTAPEPAFRLGEKTGDPLALYLEDVYTVGVNLAGLPAVSLPVSTCEVDGSTLPVGVQLVAPAWGESGMLRAARMLEREVGFVCTPALGSG